MLLWRNLRLTNKFIKMKNLIYLFMFVFLFSCNKENEDNTTPNEETTFFMKSFIDSSGAEYQYNVSGKYYCTYTKIGTIMNIQSSNTDGSKTITLSLSNFTGVGVYPTISNIDGVSNVGQYAINNVSFTTTYQNYLGSIKITEYDPTNKIIKGEFDLRTKELYGNNLHHLFGGSFVCNGAY